jgi:predicted AlkP superfamily pyrophosphatase or phosphodiesterase
MIPYIPTYTACGHSCIYTGSVPSIHGITGNNWFDNDLGRSVYCTEDHSVQTVGSSTKAGEMSPRNLLTTTVTDELRLATNFRSKVIGIALKDRGSILPAGHSANAAYWYDYSTGSFITSTYYGTELPDWVIRFNDRKLVDQYYQKGWKTLYPPISYTQGTADQMPWEGKPFGAEQKGFPYDLSGFVGKDYAKIASTPYGNDLTEEMAKAAIDGEKLGQGACTDFLAISFSSTDYVGHAFGPNSIEAEDTYLRLDKTLTDLMNYLDTKVGKGNYLLFLSADHGAAHVAGFMHEHSIPGGTFDDAGWKKEMDGQLDSVFHNAHLIKSFLNYQVYLDHDKIDSLHLDVGKVQEVVLQYLRSKPAVARAFVLEKLMETPLPEPIRLAVENGYNPHRGGDIQIIVNPGWMEGGPTGTTHGLWNPYDAHIPLLWYGWNVHPGRVNRTVYMTDIAPTVAAMLHIQMPNGCIGHVIGEVAGN